MTATATVTCEGDCFELTMSGEHETKDDREFLNKVGIPVTLKSREVDQSGTSEVCSNCGGGFTVRWDAEGDGGD